MQIKFSVSSSFISYSVPNYCGVIVRVSTLVQIFKTIRCSQIKSWNNTTAWQAVYTSSNWSIDARIINSDSNLLSGIQRFEVRSFRLDYLKMLNQANKIPTTTSYKYGNNDVEYVLCSRGRPFVTLVSSNTSPHQPQHWWITTLSKSLDSK